MPKRTSDYHTGLRERLKDPQFAASYLRSAMEESRDLFFVALRNVAQARQISVVAKKSNLNRETLYRMLSEAGNPTYDSLMSVLITLGLRLSVEPLLPMTPALSIARSRRGSVTVTNVQRPTQGQAMLGMMDAKGNVGLSFAIEELPKTPNLSQVGGLLVNAAQVDGFAPPELMLGGQKANYTTPYIGEKHA